MSLPVLLALVAAAPVCAQEQDFALPTPSEGTITSLRNVTFGSADGVPLQMDVIGPADGKPAPALIFSYAAVGAERTAFDNGLYRRWAELAASRGVIGILADLRAESAGEDTAALLDHLTRNAARYGIDPGRIAIYGASANAARVLPFVENPAETRIKAAIIYYGVADIDRFRLDLPVLYVRAGLDRPGLNRDILALASRAVAQNAPLTLLNHPSGYHAFELSNHDDATLYVIDRTIEFVKEATEPAYQAALRQGSPEAAAAGHLQTGDYNAAADAYERLVAAKPDDARLRLAYGEALLAASRYAAACAQFDRLRDAPLGARDRGLPAARACLQSGDAEAAMAWLRTIPARFLPPTIKEEPVFAPLASRPDFKALFAPPP